MDYKEKNGAKEFKVFIAQNIIWVMLALVIVGGTFAKDWIQDRWQYNEFTLHELDKDATRDMAITELLYKMNTATKADRAYVFRFHNGGYLADGIPFKKTSCTHEVVKPGVSREINNLKDIPLSTIPECTKLIVDNDDSFTIKVNTLTPGTFRSILESEAIEFTMCHRLLMSDEVWGFVGIDYLRPPPVEVEPGKPPCAAFNTYAHLIELEIIKKAER